MRKNDRRVIQAAAVAAGVPPDAFTVEEQFGVVIVNHPDSMTWPSEVRSSIKDAVKRVTGKDVAIT